MSCKVLYARLFLMTFMVTLLACGSKGSPPTPPAQPTQEEHVQARAKLEEEAAKKWKQLKERQKCNLLNGCVPAKELVSMSPDVAAQAAKKIVAFKRSPYWRIQLLRALRFVRDHRVQKAQREMLSDKAWPIRSYAAVGLGYARDKSFKEQLATRLAHESNYGAQIGYLWSETTLDPRSGREKLVEHIRQLPETRDIRVHLMALDAIQSMKLVELREQVQGWLGHRNFFVVRESVRTISDLHDRSATPLLIPLLDHDQPMVQREALDTLRRFTGLKHARKRSAFEKWCEDFCRPTKSTD